MLGPVHVGFVVDKVALGQVFLQVLWFFPCQYHSTVVPYSQHIIWRDEQIGLLVAAAQRHSLTLLT
jgi:hypothetical protein